MDIMTWVQILDDAIYISHKANTHKKDMHQTMDKGSGELSEGKLTGDNW